MNKQEYLKFLNKIKNVNYPKQDHWDIFDSFYYEKVSLFENMKNFRINGISNMLETGLPSQERQDLIKHNKCYNTVYEKSEIVEIESRFEELVLMMGANIDKYFCNSLVGNPRKHEYTHNNKVYFLNFDDLYHAYAAWQIDRYNDKTPASILEIGGGYGNLCNKLKRIYPGTKYFIVDIPEVLLVQHYYLTKSSNNLKILNLVGEKTNITNQLYTDYDVILVPFYLLESVSLRPEIIINCRSFGEMPVDTLTDYFNWIQNKISRNGLFYTVNRYVFTKSKDRNKIRDYPFDKQWLIEMSKPQWLQTHLHEFLLKRTDNESNSLELLLQSFPISTPPPGPIMEKILPQKEWIKNQM